MGSLIKLLVAVGVITFVVIYAKHAISNWKTKKARKKSIEDLRAGEFFSMAIELPHGSVDSKKFFSMFLARIGPKMTGDQWLDASCLVGFPEQNKPGDQPVLTFMLRCHISLEATVKNVVKNSYKDATLIPFSSEAPLQTPMLEAVDAYWMEHFHEPDEGQGGGEPYSDSGNGVIGDGEIQMTSGGGIAGKLQARKAARA
jgi:hypothetical protein